MEPAQSADTQPKHIIGEKYLANTFLCEGQSETIIILVHICQINQKCGFLGFILGRNCQIDLFEVIFAQESCAICTSHEEACRMM